jgi:hypothetical protein
MSRSKGIQVRLECPNCGATKEFELQVSLGGEATGIAMSCTCGGEMIDQPGAFYSGAVVDGSLVTVMRRATAADLGEVAKVVEQVQRTPSVATEEVAAALEATDTEVGRALGEWVRANGGWLGVIAVLVAIGQLVHAIVMGFVQSDDDGPSPEELEKTVQDAVKDSWRREDQSGRNQPCPCGSGTKFKNCHGLPESVQRELQERRQKEEAGRTLDGARPQSGQSPD